MQKKLGGGKAGTGPELAKGIFHSIEHNAQWHNWGSHTGGWSGFGEGQSDISQLEVSNCIVQRLFSVFYLSLFIIIIIPIILFHFIFNSCTVLT